MEALMLVILFWTIKIPVLTSRHFLRMPTRARSKTSTTLFRSSLQAVSVSYTSLKIEKRKVNLQSKPSRKSVLRIFRLSSMKFKSCKNWTIQISLNCTKFGNGMRYASLSLNTAKAESSSSISSTISF